MEISKEDVENPEHALSKVHEALSTHPLIAVPWPVLVERAWKLQPKKVALTCGDQTITYEEFVAYAGIVQRMCMRTVERGAHVLVTFSDSPCSRLTWAVVMYALAASGVPFSLMDRRTLTNAPARERMLERWVPKVWICCDREAHSAPVGGMARIPCRTDVALDFINKEVVVDGMSSPVQFPVEAPQILATAESPCFVDWTSGSTSGLPKGVVTTHKTLINMMLWAWSDERMFFNSGAMREVIAANLFLLWYWWQPLCIGASTVLIQDKELNDLEVHARKLRCNAVTIVDCMTPSLLGAMLDYISGEEDGELERLPPKVVVSGEPLSVQVCRKFFETQPEGSRIINLFSTTETGDAAFCSITEGEIPLWSDAMAFAPIGNPIWNVKLHIEKIDEKDEAGAGEGELYVDHIGGTMAYVEDSEQTAAGFGSGYGWRSRDRVKPIDGLGLAIVGRADDNVKIRGFKVDLRLVEAKARDFVGVGEVCAMPAQDELVIAYTAPAGAVEPHDLLDFLRAEDLPAGHVPQRAVHWQGAFPMMKTGKIDKGKVKELIADVRRARAKSSQDTLNASKSSMRGQIEKRVASVWEDTLGIDFSLDGSFWRQCGGQSLTAMRIAAALRIPAKFILDGTLDTPRDIIDFLTQGRDAPRRNLQLGTSLRRSDANEDRRIAVVGASGRWPGIGQTSFSALLEALRGEPAAFNPFSAPPDGHTGVGKSPIYYTAAIVLALGNVPGGYYLDPHLVSGFDVDFWSHRGVSDPLLLDPHQRMWLEMAYEALTDGGMGPAIETGEAINCGVMLASEGASAAAYYSFFLLL
ncbi:amp dependent ligase/synthetase, putative [Perkinsus marinus ATCC 50983]|uniref:Amp dependent ligase/synthetase, putative n=1 Tax=Perkinsus marinus (strain ATCC 50983 / TXsc) TaxID=423536 RepID=C5LBF0_PERM5|nr:amp dependent ligase/synthetase, putative [Perkinsus marinus ATCC 50983]EER06078.1 amp dependent ligase/synthetase, putative [Perkinsus marinus ATCC 50983]|eukprot:XP_002774262.1 amp dependent ligase/synthetase, putative [Perkinsus marinus ATCC 50983]